MSINVITLFWSALAILIIGSVYFIIEGYKVHKLFADSIVGKLVKTLVVVLLIELYSLGIVCIAFMTFYRKGVWVLLPIVFLWIISLMFAILAVRSAKQQVAGLVK
jgi:hypothetical protein